MPRLTPSARSRARPCPLRARGRRSRMARSARNRSRCGRRAPGSPTWGPWGQKCPGAADLSRVPLRACAPSCVEPPASSGAPGAPRERHPEMAGTAEQPVVVEPALPAAVGNRDDVIRLPARPLGAPALARGTVGHRRLRTRPLAVRLDYIQAAQPTDPLVALLDLASHVPRAAADLPFVYARVAEERAPGGCDQAAAPAADRSAGVVAVGLPPAIGGDGALAAGAHQRPIGGWRPGAFALALPRAAGAASIY